MHVPPHRFRSHGLRDRQDIGEQFHDLGVRDERPPFGFEIEQLWTRLTGQPLCRWAKGKRPRVLADTPMPTGIRNGDWTTDRIHRALSRFLASVRRATGFTGGVLLQVGGGLLVHHKGLEQAILLRPFRDLSCHPLLPFPGHQYLAVAFT
jgi:hypothetical protein